MTRAVTPCSLPSLPSYAVEHKIEPFYKGGKVQLDQAGRHLVCVCGSRVNVLDVASGAVLRSLEQEDQEDITAFDLSPDDEVLVTASRALLLAQWAWREGTVTRLWKAVHTAPVAAMAFDPTSTLLATGGCDGAVRVWDIVRHYGTHHFRGSPGVVHLVAFHPDSARLLLFSSAADAAVRVWSLRRVSVARCRRPQPEPHPARTEPMRGESRALGPRARPRPRPGPGGSRARERRGRRPHSAGQPASSAR